MSSSVERKSFKKTISPLFVLEEDFYPESWRDDQKMSVLLNTFRPRDVNPEHYDQKMKFWKEMIENYCEYKGSPAITVKELKSVFKRNGTSPYCLTDVLNQMSAERNLTSKEEFMSKPKSLVGWAFNSLLIKPLSWGFVKIKEKLVSSASDEEEVFVVKSALIYQSKILQQHVRNRHSYNNIISMNDLMSTADDIEGLNKDGILLVLHYLSAVENQVFIEENNLEAESDHHHKILLKFSEPHEKVQPITEMERSIYNLEQTEKFLLQTMEKKEHQLNEILAQVKDCLKNGKKQMAKTFLRKKHMVETDLVKSLGILDNVQTMLQKVQSSKSDKEIFHAYRTGSDAIKKAFAENGINLDKVHDVIEDMQEIYQDQEEYEAAISEPMRGPYAVDDSELEKELEDLMKFDDKDKNSGNIGGQPQPVNKVTQEMDQLDRELEMRLKRLRSDFTDIDEPSLLSQHKTSSRPTGLKQ